MQNELYKRPKVPLKGLLLLFSVLLLVGIVIGGIASFLGNYMYLVLIFPAFMGAAAGFFIKAIVVTEKIRSPFIVVVAGIFSAVIIYGSMHFFDYLRFRSEFAKVIQTQVVAEYGKPEAEGKVQAFIDYVLVNETGLPGFVGFVLLEAKKGVSLSDVGPGNSSSATNLGVFTWLYWLIEMGFIGGVSIASAYKITRDLFCEHCDAWVAVGEHVGGVKPEFLSQVVELIKRRDFAGVARLLQSYTDLPSIEFYTRTCKTCKTFPFYLTGFAISSGKHGQTRSKLFMVQTLTSSERFALTSALKEQEMEENTR